MTEEEKQIRKERVLYIYFKLKEKKQKVFIESFIKKQGITSESTARRIITDAANWKQGEIDLFLAIYTPTKSDSEAIGEVLGLNASKVSNEVTEDDKCTECDTEAAHIINELAAKNEELQKELHTSKNVITTLQNGINELNEIVTESKIAIAEVCKERDEKSEEIRELNLELQKYKNDLNIVLDDKQKLECLLHDSIHSDEESKEFRDIIEKMIQLYTAKNKDYGNAFSQSYNEFGAVISAIRINDKLNRFKTLIKQNSEVKTESIKDTLIDLANYAVMTIMEINNDSKSA